MLENRITRTLNALTAELNRSADRILRQEYGLTYSQYIFLIHVAESGPIGVGRLAGRLAISQPAVSQRLSWFESRGLVALEADKTHKSRVLINLTKAGRVLVNESSQFLENSFRKKMEALKVYDLNALNTQLTAILRDFTALAER